MFSAATEIVADFFEIFRDMRCRDQGCGQGGAGYEFEWHHSVSRCMVNADCIDEFTLQIPFSTQALAYFHVSKSQPFLFPLALSTFVLRLQNVFHIGFAAGME